jgi:5-methyltetrahydrofolate--homocysteine methyltransferase
MMGVSPEKALETLTELGVVAIGANCGGGTQELETAIKKMSAAHPSLPLVAKSNAGIPHLVDNVPVYDASPEDMGKYATRVRQYGASIIGACCGSTPDHIREIAKELGAQSKLE